MDANKIREIRLIRENPRFRRYPEYKESGVAWIGEIPRHWNLSMLKYAARLVYGDTLISENRENGVVPVYGSNGIIDTHSSANALSPAIVVGRKGSLGKVQYSDVPCFVIDTAYYIDRRTSHVNLRWLHYVLQSLKLERFRNSVLPGLNRESTEGQYVPLITVEEQIQIANFLDRKTEQIDELIRIKERRIELLQAQRTALINQAVTKGLDPNVEMKPSGVEWIAEIPKHWESKRLGYVSTIFKGGTPKRNVDRYFQGDLPWARPVDITALQGALYIHDTEIHISEEALGNSGARCLPPGTVLLTSRATIGETAITTVPMATNQGFANFVCNRQLLNIYLAYYLRAIKDLLISLGNGSTFLEVTKGTLVGVGIPLPPLSEQKQIVDFLARKTEQIDELIAAELRKIELLKEYRQSLISEAVTGKIDVRNEV
jgi:type I restriction enzyme S subunit